jgi:hypothetical protein
VSFRLEDEDGVPLGEPEPIEGRLGVGAVEWASFYGVPQHVRWNPLPPT